MTRGRFLATDLDRTLIPNGVQRESPGAREVLFALAAARGLALIYVTGRRLALVDAAIREYSLARPGHVIGDVGTSIWADSGGEWRPLLRWVELLAQDWPAVRGPELAARLADDPQLEPQESEAQGEFKASFYADLAADPEAVRARLSARLETLGARSVIVQSVDEQKGVGLVDVLPAQSSKRHALEFLRTELGLSRDQLLFAGDSGNDLAVLASPIRSVLVANGAVDVRQRATAMAEERGATSALYLARGGMFGMNGNYAAGILEGWAHFHPEDREAIERLVARGPEMQP